MKLPNGYFDNDENIIWTNQDDEWDLPVGHYMIIKEGLVKTWNGIEDGTLFWTSYGLKNFSSGWTQDESASTYKTTKRKLPEGGRYAIIKSEVNNV